jgi:hypothetical protein
MPDAVDPKHWLKFCRDFLPGILANVSKATDDEAAMAADDVMLRAEAVARMDRKTREILAAPAYEESYEYDPADAPPWLKALTTLVIRNSQLEELHTKGLIEQGGIAAITESGVGPLSHLLAAGGPLDGEVTGSPFAGLTESYPRAWACLSALQLCINAGGGRAGYRLPDAPVPELPDISEVAEAATTEISAKGTGILEAVVFSGVDPRFDPESYSLLKRAQEENDGLTFGFTSLSRISRDSRKLFRVLEFLLAHDTKLITTNHLITGREVWFRKGYYVKPDSRNFGKGIEDPRGMSGSYRKTAESFIRLVNQPGSSPATGLDTDNAIPALNSDVTHE